MWGGPLSVISVLDVRDNNIKAEACKFTWWDDLICYIDREHVGQVLKMEGGLQESKVKMSRDVTSSFCKQMQKTVTVKYSNAPLVHLGYTCHRRKSAGETIELSHMLSPQQVFVLSIG